MPSASTPTAAAAAAADTQSKAGGVEDLLRCIDAADQPAADPAPASAPVPESAAVVKARVPAITIGHEPHTGLAIHERACQASDAEVLFKRHRYVALASLLQSFHSGSRKPGFKPNWATIGVVAAKSAVKRSKRGSEFCVWTISNLSNHQFHLYLFGAAMQAHGKLASGSIVVAINAECLPKASDKFSIKVPERLVCLGLCPDYGICKATKNGLRCNVAVDLTNGELCDSHSTRSMWGHSTKRSTPTPTRSTAANVFTFGSGGGGGAPPMRQLLTTTCQSGYPSTLAPHMHVSCQNAVRDGEAACFNCEVALCDTCAGRSVCAAWTCRRNWCKDCAEDAYETCSGCANRICCAVKCTTCNGLSCVLCVSRHLGAAHTCKLCVDTLNQQQLPQAGLSDTASPISNITHASQAGPDTQAEGSGGTTAAPLPVASGDPAGAVPSAPEWWAIAEREYSDMRGTWNVFRSEEHGGRKFYAHAVSHAVRWDRPICASLARLKVFELKEICRAQGCTLSGKKAEIVERLWSLLEDADPAVPRPLRTPAADASDAGGPADLAGTPLAVPVQSTLPTEPGAAAYGASAGHVQLIPAPIVMDLAGACQGAAGGQRAAPIVVEDTDSEAEDVHGGTAGQHTAAQTQPVPAPILIDLAGTPQGAAGSQHTAPIVVDSDSEAEAPMGLAPGASRRTRPDAGDEATSVGVAPRRGRAQSKAKLWQGVADALATQQILRHLPNEDDAPDSEMERALMAKSRNSRRPHTPIFDD